LSLVSFWVFGRAEVAGLFEFLKLGLEQLVEVGGSETQLRSLHSKLCRERTQAAKFFGLQETWPERSEVCDEGPAARYGADDAFALKILKGAGYGVGVDAEVGSGAARGRQRVTGAKDS